VASVVFKGPPQSVDNLLDKFVKKHRYSSERLTARASTDWPSLNIPDRTFENLSIALERSSKRKEAEPLRAGPSSHVVAKLFLDFRLPCPCRRPIPFTETLAASAIPPFDKTRSQVVASAIAATQLV
jgi:hypothetical protein